jgi:hypothetical protein
MSNWSWYDMAVQSLEDDLDEGIISYEEFRKELRELNAELQQARIIAGEEAYNNY